MKTGAPQHPKLIDLSMRLEIPIYAVVGLMEMLWHFTDKHAIRGDIGKYTDSVIAQGLGWDKDVHALMEALVSSRLLDRCAVNRLVVHDWPEHCQDYCKKRLKAKKQVFATITPLECGDTKILENSGKFHNFLQENGKTPELPLRNGFDTGKYYGENVSITPLECGDTKILENSGKFQKKGVGGALVITVPVEKSTSSISPPTPSNQNPSEKDLQEVCDAWDRHQCFHNREPKEMIIQQVLSMNGKFDWTKFRENHQSYCDFWSDKGWNFCKITFLGWINAGMPPSPVIAQTKPETPKICPRCKQKPCVCFERQLAKERNGRTV